jgi:Cd2+/Zn2+-exporting ATPase
MRQNPIESLLKLQVEEVTLVQSGNREIVHPEKVKIGQIIQIKPGEKVALDGILINITVKVQTFCKL